MAPSRTWETPRASDLPQPLSGLGVGSPCLPPGRGPSQCPPRGGRVPPCAPGPAESKLEKNEEAALLSWEVYLKENYLQNQRYQQKQRPEQQIQDIGEK